MGRHLPAKTNNLCNKKPGELPSTPLTFFLFFPGHTLQTDGSLSSSSGCLLSQPRSTQVTELALFQNRAAGVSKGCGFVFFKERSAAESAINTLHEKVTMQASFSLTDRRQWTGHRALQSVGIVTAPLNSLISQCDVTLWGTPNVQ